MHKPDALPRTYLFLGSFFLAFLVRAVFVADWNGTPYGPVPFLDAQAYDDWAKAVASGNLLRDRAFYQSPLYSYLLGFFYWFTGRDLLLAGLLNALFEAGTATVMTVIAGRAFGPCAALFTALLACFFGPSLFYTASLMKEPLALFLLSLFLLFALSSHDKNKVSNALSGGVFLGLAVLTRGNALLLAPVFLLIQTARWKRKAIVPAFAFTAGLLLCLLPATLHNAAASHDFVPVSYADGFNFYIGHSPVANGVNAYPPEVSTDPIQEELNIYQIAEQESGRSLKPSEVSRYWRNRAKASLLDNPERIFLLYQNKLSAFWSGAQRFDNYDASFIRAHFDTILDWPLVPFWLVSSLAAFSSIVSVRKRTGTTGILLAYTATYMISVLLFYVTDRYRLPVIVFLLPLAGAAIPVGIEIVKEKKWRRMASACAALCLFLFLGLRPDHFETDLRAYNWGVLTMLYEQQGKREEALEAFKKGIAIAPEGVGAGAYARASYALLAQGQIEQAENTLLKAKTLFPEDGTVLYNLGRLEAYRGNLPQALACFENGARLTPHYVLNYLGMGRIHEKTGNREKALQAVLKGLSINPSNAELLALKERL